MIKKLNISPVAQTILMYVGIAGILVVLFAARAFKSESKPQLLKMNVLTTDQKNQLLLRDDIHKVFEKELGYDPILLTMEESRLERYEELLEKHPYVKSAEAFIDHQKTLVFDLSIREPILRMKAKGSFYLDAEGNLMPLTNAYAARVPLLHGYIDRANEKEILDILEFLQDEKEFSTWIDQIYKDKNGDFLITLIWGDTKVRIGKWEDIQDKIERFKLFMKQVIPVKGWNAYEEVNLKYKGQAIGKKLRP